MRTVATLLPRSNVTSLLCKYNSYYLEGRRLVPLFNRPFYKLFFSLSISCNVVIKILAIFWDNALKHHVVLKFTF